MKAANSILIAHLLNMANTSEKTEINIEWADGQVWKGVWGAVTNLVEFCECNSIYELCNWTLSMYFWDEDDTDSEIWNEKNIYVKAITLA